MTVTPPQPQCFKPHRHDLSTLKRHNVGFVGTGMSSACLVFLSINLSIVRSSFCTLPCTDMLIQ